MSCFPATSLCSACANAWFSADSNNDADTSNSCGTGTVTSSARSIPNADRAGEFRLLLQARRNARRPAIRSFVNRKPASIATVSNHCYAEGFEPFACRRKIENNLGARTHYDDGRRSEDRQVRGNVRQEPRCTPPMPPVANTLIPARVSDPTGGSDGRGSVPFLRDCNRKIANTDLLDVVALCKKTDLLFV